jgi:hypothetical protein
MLKRGLENINQRNTLKDFFTKFLGNEQSLQRKIRISKHWMEQKENIEIECSHEKAKI